RRVPVRYWHRILRQVPASKGGWRGALHPLHGCHRRAAAAVGEPYANRDKGGRSAWCKRCRSIRSYKQRIGSIYRKQRCQASQVTKVKLDGDKGAAEWRLARVLFYQYLDKGSDKGCGGDRDKNCTF